MCIVFCMIAFLLGSFTTLIISKWRKNYDGKIVVTEGFDGAKLFSLELDGDPMKLDEKETVAFKIVKPRVDEEVL